MMAPVSVLMSTFNRAHYLEDAIGGILDQTVAPAQVIVVNDGSTDETAAILAKYGDRIICLEQENSGKSVALNRAFSHVTGEFVWVFDDDDVPFPDALAAHLAALEAHPEAGFSYSPFVRVTTAADGSLVATERQEEFPEVGPEEFFPRLLGSCFTRQQGSLVRTRCMRAVGGFREDYARSLDYDYLLRLARISPAVRVSGPTFYFRIHAGARGLAGDSFAAEERAMRWYRVNKAIFSELCRDLALWEYLPHLPGAPPPASCDEGAARIARIGVMGGKGLWDFVVAELRDLVDTGRLRHIGQAVLREGLEDAFDSDLSIRDLVANRDVLRRLVAALRDAGSADLRLVCARKMYHSVAAGRGSEDSANDWRVLRAAAQTCGIAAIGKLAVAKLTNRPILSPV